MNADVTVGQLTQLTTLDELKTRRAERAAIDQRAVVARCREKVQEIQLLVDQFNADAQRVTDFLAEPETATCPVKLNDAYARRHWIIYDREKEEFYLKQALQELDQANAQLVEKNQLWNRLRARLQETRQLLTRAQRQQVLAQDTAESLLFDEQCSSTALVLAGDSRG